jgi:pSer/pThr/pTyr-binding forkhead associated (FHA) protein
MSDETVIIRKTPPSFAYLFWLNGIRRGDHVMLQEAGTTLGRSGVAEVAMDDPTVSDEHARIRLEGGNWYIYDLASSNAVLVGGEPVHRHALVDNDRLRIGMTDLVFRLVR